MKVVRESRKNEHKSAEEAKPTERKVKHPINAALVL
jgi:hypothetical protein